MHPDDDWGAYVEYDDQIAGEYGCVESCDLRRDALEVKLCKPLGKLKVLGFAIPLKIEDAAYGALALGLKCLFQDDTDLLSIR